VPASIGAAVVAVGVVGVVGGSADGAGSAAGATEDAGLAGVADAVVVPLGAGVLGGGDVALVGAAVVAAPALVLTPRSEPESETPASVF
jgi:hypothetical protein